MEFLKNGITGEENYCDVAYLLVLELFATATSTGIEGGGVDGRRPQDPGPPIETRAPQWLLLPCAALRPPRSRWTLTVNAPPPPATS
jgi:hypothetical protein